ncbi:acetoin utilization protein AcuC [Paenibacillus baekrokdamisoli]|uniref:Acetoin utilization protein AcuC n=1 Tax=Paenibacillus baekrokdamisoli TaxID=1712516 RepID=A0A3G9J190_9BACL|nr:acetoin utilization protein AcuC [Paenibacillus baekrokdamisoli]MBB3067197.1 acetoin utilization protein AcuC [Paenibacillus baekrokdamisoli]BBH19611.1 acetoin utilization protein AcuC [Paenibacillus baekrokdamisoli]
MTANAVFIHQPEAARYKFNEDHPFHPQRLKLAMDLLEESNALSEEQLLTAPHADEAMLSLVHRQDYINAIKQLSEPSPSSEWTSQAHRYGLQTEDTPFFVGMHDAAASIVGGSLLAADLVMTGQAKHAYHMAGGLHHAFPDHASGFCIYNDAAIAITRIRQQFGARVLYIDTDVHHGDGVQWTFYDDPNICTYSIHETGKFLFPGTGFVHERGTEHGFGSSFNVPVEPYTEDDSWLESFRSSLEKVTAAFKPDVIISQHGCDAHAFDPLSHTHCSMRIYQEMPAIIHRLAHEYTEGRWVAIGGGGYDIWRVVPRAWALVWLEMTDHPIAHKLRNKDENESLPDKWLARWQAQSPEELPKQWLDDTSSWTAIPRRTEIEAKNRHTTTVAVQDI